MSEKNNTISKKIAEWESQEPLFIKSLWPEVKYLRERKDSKRNQKKKLDLKRYVWCNSSPERLKNGMGMEITLVFRSSACSWTRSESGGCTMCGYWNDRADTSITDDDLWTQFDTALENNKELLSDDSQEIVFKMFTSGSFCDPDEFSIELQIRILSKLKTFNSIKEIVIETRPQYVTEQLLTKYSNILDNNKTYLEIAMGLESSNDFIRNNIVNKGFTWNAFLKSTQLIHKFRFGVKGYILFKPPFMKEYAAIEDLIKTIKDCFDVGVNTISINPTNIQKNTICEQLFLNKKYRSPWHFSLLHVIKSTISESMLKSMRVICDPSANGKARGVHNCLPNDESTNSCKQILEKFIETQDPNVIPSTFSTDNGACWDQYLYTMFC